MSAIRGSGPERVLGDRIAPALEAWFGSCFERLCREALPLIYAMEGVTAGFEVGEYWSARPRNAGESPSPDASQAAQTDVVGLRDDNWSDLGECKWGRVRSAPALEAELDRKARLYPNRRGATLGRRYFVRRKPGSRVDAKDWYSLQDLYALPDTTRT